MDGITELKANPFTASDGCQDEALLNDWHTIGFSTDFTPGTIYPSKLLGRELIVWRDEDEVVHVWEDLCVHRGARLSKGWIENNQVVCPYHGWEYDCSGKCTKIPAAPDEPPLKKARAFTYHAKERYGFVWVCLGTPAWDIPPFPEWDNDAYLKVHIDARPMRASGYRIMDNNLDGTHFPFVHPGMNGVREKPQKFPAYTVEETETGLKSSEIVLFQPFGDARGVPVLGGYTYYALQPLTCYFSKRVVEADQNGNPISDKSEYYASFLTVQQIDETNSIIRSCAALNVTPMPDPEAVRKRGLFIRDQDVAIVETQRPERIPIDLRTELHHRVDLMGQRYRQWLRAKGITYGAFF